MLRFTSFIAPVLSVILGLSVSYEAWAIGTDRGTWFFDVPGHDLASSTVVSSSSLQDFTIGQFQKFNITQVYNSYANPVPPPVASDIASWHTKLHTAGMTPMLMLSDVGSTADLNFFTQQLVNYNNGRPAAEQYDGVKLDLEPQASVAWNGANLSLSAAINRRDMLLTLRDTYASIRAHLDANGEAGTPIYADLPVWFDNTTGFIGWGEGTGLTAEQEKDQWFSDIATNLQGITLLAFGTTFFSVIESNVNWEINNFGGDVRVALEASVGGGGTWPNFPALEDMAVQIETFYTDPTNNPSGHSIGIDFQDFAQLFTAAAPEPHTAVLSLMGLAVLQNWLRRRPMA